MRALLMTVVHENQQLETSRIGVSRYWKCSKTARDDAPDRTEAIGGTTSLSEILPDHAQKMLTSCVLSDFRDVKMVENTQDKFVNMARISLF